jgi:uncharacterized circularly permuted ATP-grasp superfamily protein
VRDGIVYLRTLGGLERVSVIFRRLDSDFADPLELRADSALGVPGLVDVIRAGNVVMANALGGGVVESPALDAYLPNVSRALFGEELLVDIPPTVWCGTAWGRAEGLAHPGAAVSCATRSTRGRCSRAARRRASASDLGDDERAAFADRIERRGATLVVHDIVPLGVAPTFDGGAFASRPMSLRVFAAWTPNGYVVMPGGTRAHRGRRHRCARSRCNRAPRAKTCGRSRAGRSTRSACCVRRARASRSAAPGNEAPSRAMDNLFWLARYAERTEEPDPRVARRRVAASQAIPGSRPR